MSKRGFSIEFYRIILPEETEVTFEGILDQATERSGRERSVEGEEYFIRMLHDLWARDKQGRSYFEGTAIKARTSDIPYIADQENLYDPIQVKEGQGIAQETSFVFYPELDVLVIRGNWSIGGVHPSRLANYFQNLSGVGDLEFLPILNLDAWKDFNRAEIIREVSFRYAAPTSGEVYKGSTEGTKQVIKDLNKLQGGQAEIVFRATGRGTSMSKPNVINYLKSVVAKSDVNGLEQMRITDARDSEDRHLPVIDLMGGKMKERGFAEKVDGRIPRAACISELINAYAKRRDELMVQFGADERKAQ